MNVQRALDLAGIFVFALSGGSLAVRRGFDAVGIAALALVTGLGGGLVRDVLLGDLPPIALRDELLLGATAVAAVVVLVGHTYVERMERPVLAFDAAGLGLFCVVGTTRALDAGLGDVAAVLIGTISAVGGGVIRDVLAREVPTIFRTDSALYAIPAMVGAVATVAVWELDLFGGPAAVALAGSVFVLRMLAMRYGWGAPTARLR